MSFDHGNYIELSYIKADGSAFIDTGIIPNYETTKIEFDGFEPTAKSLFGSTTARFGATGSGGYLRIDYNGAGVSTNIPYTERHKWCLDTNKSYIDGNLIHTYDAATGSDIVSVKLFARADGTSDRSEATCYSCQMWDNGTLTRSFTPAKRRSDGVLGMYDTAWDESAYGYIELDGSDDENWSFDSTYGRFKITVTDAKLAEARTIEAYAPGWRCLYNQEAISSVVNGDFYVGNTGFYFHESAESLNEWRSKISKNPIKLYYQRKTDTEFHGPFFINAGTGTFTAGDEVQQEITSYKRGILCKTANLFDKDNPNIIPTAYITANAGSGSIVTAQTDRTIYLPCEPSTTYSIWFGTSYTKRIASSGAIPVVGGQITDCTGNFSTNTRTYTTSSTANYLVVQLFIDADMTAGAVIANAIKTLVIVEGSTVPTEYIPYGNKLLNYCRSAILCPRLPSEYTELEYIQNKFPSRINTNIVISSAVHEFYCRYYCSALDSYYIFQSRDTSMGIITGLSGSSTNATILYCCSGINLMSSITRTTGHIYTVKGSCDGTTMTLYVKDETAGTEATNTASLETFSANTTPICLFGNMADNYISDNNRIFEAYIKQDGELVYSMVAAKRNSDNVAGAYDLIAKTFKTTDNSIPIIAGPEHITQQQLTCYSRKILFT